MAVRSDLIRYLRDHIVGAMHVGQLHSGDRLESIRQLAKRLGRNERTIAAAYAALEAEGLVEVQGRSGVVVARQEIFGGDASEETARWLSGVVAEAWKRRIAVQALPETVQRLTASRRVRCALVDVIEDGIVALRHELESEFGFDVRVVAPDALGEARDADFFTATSFYAASIRRAVERLGKPLVVQTVHPGLKSAVESRIREGRLTVVCLDPCFADRMRVTYSPDDPSRVHCVAADDRRAVAALDPDEPVMLTRAASRLTGPLHVPLIFPHSPTMSPETALALATVLVRRNAEALARSPRDART